MVYVRRVVLLIHVIIFSLFVSGSQPPRTFVRFSFYIRNFANQQRRNRVYTAFENLRSGVSDICAAALDIVRARRPIDRYSTVFTQHTSHPVPAAYLSRRFTVSCSIFFFFSFNTLGYFVVFIYSYLITKAESARRETSRVVVVVIFNIYNKLLRTLAININMSTNQL